MSDADLNPPTLTQEQGQEGSPSDGASSPEPTTTPAFQTSPATVKRRQRHLLERLRRSVSRQPHDIGEGMDKVVFGVAATATIAFVVWGFVDPHGLGRVSKWALGGTISNFGWLFVLSSTLFVVFIVFVAASRFGKIPLGGDAEEPEYSTGSWVSMMFATGMGIGLIFYGVGEPLYFYMSPPPDTVDPQTAKAASTAMGTALFHWTIYPWAMYALVGLGMAYGTYRLGRSQLFSAMFTSLFGRQAIDGVGGRIINILAIVATLFGSACSLGLGALQIGGGMMSTNLVDKVSSGMLVAIIAVLTACFVASAISGIEKGIQWLSNINMVYWAWWISWTPFVGMFIARISRGRTIRQFVTGVMFVPSVVSLIWFAIFGGGAIGLQERAERAGRTADALVHLKADGTPDVNFDTVLFDLLNAMPVHRAVLIVLMVLAVVLVAIFFVTGADSASIVMGGLSEKGAIEPSRFTVVFWGVATGGVASAMLLAGGDDPAEVLTGLRDITIVSALPFVFVMLLLCVSLYKDLNNDPMLLRHSLANQVLVDSVTTAVTAADEPHEVEAIELHTTLSSTSASEDKQGGCGDVGREPVPDVDGSADGGAADSDGEQSR